jgi:hypothetical protein
MELFTGNLNLKTFWLQMMDMSNLQIMVFPKF